MKTTDGSLDVVFASDRRYLPHLATALSSLLVNNPSLVRAIYLLTYDIEETDLGPVWDSIPHKFKDKLFLCRASEQSVDELYVSGHVSPATYLRFYAAELLPHEVETVLYLDCDIVVEGDLKEFLAFQQAMLQGELQFSLAAVRESDGEHLRKFGFTSENYFNAGVLLINLAKWRRLSLGQRLYDVAENYFAKFPWWDQDVLNLVLQDDWLEISEEFNTTESSELDGNARIIHFSGRTKPWDFGCQHPAKDRYRHYREQTSFVPFKREKFGPYLYKLVTPRWWRKRRAIIKRFRRLLPRMKRET